MATDFSSKQLSETYSEGVTAEGLSLRPVVLELVGDVREKEVLDIGCGDGRYSIVFGENGAKVTAIDLSPHQIAIAMQKHSHPNINYSTGDVTSDIVEDNSIDLVFANLVVPDLDNLEKLGRLFFLSRRVLKVQGRLIFSVLHPLYLCSDQDNFDKAVSFDPKGYFNEGSNYRAEALTNAGNKMTFDETHFSLTFISKLLREQNFLIRSISESRQVPEKGMFLPKYLVFECIPAEK